jgi:autophagy-related protein 5
MNTQDYRKEVWEGKIPVCFILSPEEITSGGGIQPPEPCFMLLPRIAYLPFVYDKLEKLYSRAVGASLDDKLWLSFGPTPLKWLLPFIFLLL